MVVCKYFLQGACKFGNNCNYEHPRNQGYQSSQSSNNRYQSSNQGYDQSRFRYVANNQSNPPAQPSNLFTKLVSSNQLPPQSQSNVIDPDNITSDQEFLDYVTNDFKMWLNSSSWKLSCYAYNRTAPCLPILPDISPEEVRYAVYESKKYNRHFEEYQNYQKKYNEAIESLKQIANPNQQVKEYLLKYFHQTKNSSSQPQQQTQQASVNPFMQIIQNKQQQQQQTQLFQPQLSFPIQQANNPSLFQPQTNLPLQNFLQSQQPTQIQTSGSQLFTGQTQPNLFSQIISSSNQIMNTSIANLSTLKPSSTPFQSASASSMTADQSNNIYSKITDLTDQDMKEFQASTFTLGKVPHFPPTKEACFL